MRHFLFATLTGVALAGCTVDQAVQLVEATGSGLVATWSPRTYAVHKLDVNDPTLVATSAALALPSTRAATPVLAFSPDGLATNLLAASREDTGDIDIGIFDSRTGATKAMIDEGRLLADYLPNQPQRRGSMAYYEVLGVCWTGTTRIAVEFVSWRNADRAEGPNLQSWLVYATDTDAKGGMALVSVDTGPVGPGNFSARRQSDCRDNRRDAGPRLTGLPGTPLVDGAPVRGLPSARQARAVLFLGP